MRHSYRSWLDAVGTPIAVQQNAEEKHVSFTDFWTMMLPDAVLQENRFCDLQFLGTGPGGTHTGLGLASELTREQAWKLAQEHLRPLNSVEICSLSDVTFGNFIERHFVPPFLPTRKLSTQKRYLQTLKNHLIPAFGPLRLCGIGKLELQRFVLAKMQAGLGRESCNHLRNLMSKVLTKAKEWKFLADGHPILSVELPERQPGEEKKIMTVAQIHALLSVLREPCRTMVLLGLLTGMRIGEILGLRWKDGTSVPPSCASLKPFIAGW